MYKLCFFVPEDHLEAVKSAVFAAGGGHIGDYEHCCWQSAGEGQFRPRAGANPFLGQHDVLTRVREYKVELVCDETHIRPAIAALKRAHPYEEPAYDVIGLAAF